MVLHCSWPFPTPLIRVFSGPYPILIVLIVCIMLFNFDSGPNSFGRTSAPSTIYIIIYIESCNVYVYTYIGSWRGNISAIFQCHFHEGCDPIHDAGELCQLHQHHQGRDTCSTCWGTYVGGWMDMCTCVCVAIYICYMLYMYINIIYIYTHTVYNII